MSGLMLLANDPPSMLVPKAKPRDNNSIFYYYFYSVNLPNHLLIVIHLFGLHLCGEYWTLVND